ncbi:MAG: DTW domain-containing protein [Planctomycetes bacterium]|nr:DTW domain-containing protein [Planctomycetota bacterium]
MSPRPYTRRTTTKSGTAPRARCPTCFLQPRLCVCGLIAPQALGTRVVVYRHRKEVHKPTNTGRLAALCLVNAELRTFGGRGERFDERGLDDPARRVLLLYPRADAQVLRCDAEDDRPVTLLVPDADWRRAQKLARGEKALERLPAVCLADGAPSAFRLRKHTDARYLSTFEGIARALGVLEGDAVRAELERVFQIFVDRALYQRGQLAAELVTGGVPPLREASCCSTPEPPSRP